MKSIKNNKVQIKGWTICFLVMFISSVTLGQNTIFTNSGTSYTNTDSRTQDIYGPIDISACNSIQITMDYNFSLPWEGSGNMESSGECNFTDPCDGDPTNPNQMGCELCWDFLWVRVLVDGTEETTELIGEAGTTDAEQSGTISFTLCVQQANELEIEVYTQTWASNETVQFNNIRVDCWSDSPIPTANPNPACEGESVQLDETSGVLSNWSWTGPNGFTANSQDPVIPNFTASNAGTYTVTADDANGCAVSETIDVQLASKPTISTGESIEECGPAPVNFDLTSIEPQLNPTPGFTFEWYEDMSGMVTISNPMSYSSSGGTVYVSVTDPSSSCSSDIVAVTLVVNPQPSFSVPSDVTVCEGLQVLMDTLINPSNTNLTYTYHDGVPPTPGNQLTGVVSFNNNTTISIVGTDANGCADTQTVNLEVIDIPLAPPADNAGPYCEGETIELNASPPVIPVLTYTWTGPNGYMAVGPSQNIPNATINNEGNYELTASLFGCSSQPTTIFVDIIPLPAAPAVNDPTEVCFGESLMLSAMSDPGATYSWSGPNGFSSSSQNPLITNSSDFTDAGTYTVTPTLNGCIGPSSDLEVIVNDTPIVMLTLEAGISCPGNADASVSVSVPGGTSPLDFIWSDSQYDGMQFISGLAAGIYSVTVIDGNACSGEASISIEDPPALQLFCDEIQAESAPGAMDGSGEVFISGGNSPYSISYDNGSGISDTLDNVSPGSNIISNLSAASYAIIVTDSNGCTEECTLIITGQDCDLEIDTFIQIDSILCFGDSTASLEAVVSGGSGEYAIFWEDQDGNVVADSSIAFNLREGTYIVYVADTNNAGCATTANAVINQPSPISFNCQVLQNTSGPGMTDGIALLQISGGNAPYSISWTGPQSGTINSSNDSLQLDTLAAGEYNVLITDDNGCNDSCTFTVQGANCDISIELDTAFFIGCPTDSSLSIQINVTNATADRIIIWNGDSLNTENRSNLAADIYTIEVLDTTSGCNDVINIDRSGYTSLNFQCIVFSPPSSEGTMDGEGGLIFSSVAKPYEALITGDSSPVMLTDQRSDTLRLSALDTGTYTVFITDSLGCVDSCMFTIPPGSCDLNLSLDTAYFNGCPADSTLTINTSLDSVYPNLIYIWNNDTLPGGDRSNLAAGIYNISVLDTTSNCRSDIIVDRNTSYSPLFSCFVFTPPTVKGGRNGEAGIIIDTVAEAFDVFISGHNYNNSRMNVASDSVVFNNLDSGTYTITVIDSFGCIDSCSFFMPDGGCDFLSVDSVRVVQPDCNDPLGGSLEVFASGGSGNFNYDWNVDSLDGMRFISGLGPGTYNLTLTDVDLNCTAQASQILFPIEELELSIDYTTSFCSGDSAAVMIELLSGNTPVEVTLDGNFSGSFLSDTTLYTMSENPVLEAVDEDGCLFSEDLIINRLNEASFSLDTTICEDETLQLGGMTFSEGNTSGTVTLENAAQNGCDSIITVNVGFQSLSIEYDLIPPSCELGTNTQIEFINPIGTNDYIFYLNNNETAIPQTPYVLDGLNAGMNTFYIQSQIGCESPVENATIEEPQNIEVAIADISPINLGDSALLEGQTNLDPSTIQWTPMAFITCDSCLTTLVYPEQTTTFQLEVTDENGCTGSAEITVVVIEEEGASVYIPNVFSPNGDNINDYFTVYTEEGYAVINRLMIFDRWGELLFEERNIATNIEQSGWDGSANGEELSPGVYVYAIELENSSGQTTVYHGTITLVK